MKHWKRTGKMVKHHLKNRCRGGTSEPFNLLMFDSEREHAWHFMWNNKSFEEVAELLLRVAKIKQSKK